MMLVALASILILYVVRCELGKTNRKPKGRKTTNINDLVQEPEAEFISDFDTGDDLNDDFNGGDYGVEDIDEDNFGDLGDLGARRRRKSGTGQRIRPMDCDGVSIDSPDFARCSTTLGGGRSIVRGRPSGKNFATSLLKKEYDNLGNPLASSIRDKNHDDSGDESATGKAFPFTRSGKRLGKAPLKKKKSIFNFSSFLSPTEENSANPASKVKTNNALMKRKRDMAQNRRKMMARSKSGGKRGNTYNPQKITEGIPFQQAFGRRAKKYNGPKSLGVAVSPSSVSFGSSGDEMRRATNKLDTVNKVSSNIGGNLNLLHPLE